MYSVTCIFISPSNDRTCYGMVHSPSVCPFTIACECDILKTVGVLTLYPIQDIVCECDSLKTTCRIDFTFRYRFCTSNTADAIHLGHSKKNKMAATAVNRLTLYPMQDIACGRLSD